MFCGMILGEGVTAAAFFVYFLQLQAKSKREIAGGFSQIIKSLKI
jgi:hypothetical protein